MRQDFFPHRWTLFPSGPRTVQLSPIYRRTPAEALRLSPPCSLPFVYFAPMALPSQRGIGVIVGRNTVGSKKRSTDVTPSPAYTIWLSAPPTDSLSSHASYPGPRNGSPFNDEEVPRFRPADHITSSPRRLAETWRERIHPSDGAWLQGLVCSGPRTKVAREDQGGSNYT